MIARIDDTQFLMENLTAHPDFDFTLQSKLTWSKNVHEERDAPNQILIGAMDPWFCVLLDWPCGLRSSSSREEVH
jgi:hypothetical protein